MKGIIRHSLAVLGIAVMALSMQSCATKEKALNQLRGMATEIQYNGAQYTVKDWKDAAERYVKLNKKIAKYQYTPEEMAEIGELNGKCIGYFTTGVATNVTGKVTNAINGINGLINGLKDAMGK